MHVLLVALWIALALNLFFTLRGWRGLMIAPRRWLWLNVALLGVASLPIGLRLPLIHWYESIVGGVLGIGLFVALAAWATRRQTWDDLFAPGDRDGRRIREVAIPLDGGPMPALLIEPLSGSAVGVLVVHGAGDHKRFYSWPRLYALADAGFAALAIDVDGHGDNPRPLEFQGVLENVAAGVAWLRERYHHVAVIGISQGGCITARAVADGVDVDALVVMEAPISVNVTPAVRRREALIVAHPAAWRLQRDLGALALYRSWRSGGIRGNISYVDLIQRLDLLGSIARIRCPLMLCYAARDAVVPADQARQVAAAAPLGTTFVLVPRATHLSLPIDRRVLHTIVGWLRTTLHDS